MAGAEGLIAVTSPNKRERGSASVGIANAIALCQYFSIDNQVPQPNRKGSKMRNFVRLACRTFAIIVIASVLALAVHYYLRLRLLEHATVTIDPGKWVWVECKTDMFVATIEEVEADGIVVSVGSPPPSGLPCDVVGLRAQGKGKYFMPFRTVLGIRVDGQQVWSNPNSM